jgi:hypothetical protein
MVGAFLALGPDAAAIGQESGADEQAANEQVT